MTAKVASTKVGHLGLSDAHIISKLTVRQDTAETTVSIFTTASGVSVALVEEEEDDEEEYFLSDDELLEEGLRLCKDDQILPGGRLLEKVCNQSRYTEEHKEYMRRYKLSVALRQDLMAPSLQGWKKQGESHGNRDFIVYYKTEDGGKLTCRIESVIEQSLYVPFLAVMNESDLYETWFPSWSFPFKLGMNRSTMLKQRGRCEQVVQLVVDLPFPMNRREIVFWGYAEDDGEASRTVTAKLVSVDETFPDKGLVPPAEKGVVRMDFACDFMFRPCPNDHPALAHSKAKYPPGESKILLTTVMFCDPKVHFIPQDFLNFVTRNAIGTVWNMVLRISEQVRAGSRPAHAKIIAEKKEFYDWVAARAALLTRESQS